MVDLQTVIDELNYGKIEFDYKDDDCCTTEGEVTILLKRLAELEKNKADFVEVCRCKECANGYRKTDIAVMCKIWDRLMITEDYCSYGAKMDERSGT